MFAKSGPQFGFPPKQRLYHRLRYKQLIRSDGKESAKDWGPGYRAGQGQGKGKFLHRCSRWQGLNSAEASWEAHHRSSPRSGQLKGERKKHFSTPSNHHWLKIVSGAFMLLFQAVYAQGTKEPVWTSEPKAKRIGTPVVRNRQSAVSLGSRGAGQGSCSSQWSQGDWAGHVQRG